MARVDRRRRRGRDHHGPEALASELGLGVGISSGANFLGALKVQEELGPEAIVVTVFPDDNKKYMSTDLLRDGKRPPRLPVRG